MASPSVGNRGRQRALAGAVVAAAMLAVASGAEAGPGDHYMVPLDQPSPAAPSATDSNSGGEAAAPADDGAFTGGAAPLDQIETSTLPTLPGQQQDAVPPAGGQPPGADAQGASLQGPALQPGVATPAPPASAVAPPAAAALSGPAGWPGPLWSSASFEEASTLLGKASLPAPSPAMQALLRRLLLSGDEPSGGKSPDAFRAVRLDALYRAGLLQDASALLAQQSGAAGDPVTQLASVRLLLALGQDGKACVQTKAIPLKSPDLTGRAHTDALMLVAYCVARDKQSNHAGVAAEVLRDQKVQAPLALAVLDSLADSKTPKLPRTESVGLIDYKFLALLGHVPAERLLAKATPDLILAIANDKSAEPDARLQAAEAAARLNMIDGEHLAAVYRSAAVDAQAQADPLATSLEHAARRAAITQALARETAPVRKAPLIRALLDAARGDGLYPQVAAMLAPEVARWPLTPDLTSFRETAIEVLLAGGQYDKAVSWVLMGETAAGPAGNTLLHWMTLIDIGDAEGHVPHGSSLKYAEDLAAAGALSPLMLQRLATVLDALEYDVPIPIWQGAQNAAASDQGHLPDTGQLTALDEAAKQHNLGKVVLLAAAAIGPDRAQGAHLIALSGAIRSLKAVGLEHDARRLAFEALFEAWPRRPGG